LKHFDHRVFGFQCPHLEPLSLINHPNQVNLTPMITRPSNPIPPSFFTLAPHHLPMTFTSNPRKQVAPQAPSPSPHGLPLYSLGNPKLLSPQCRIQSPRTSFLKMQRIPNHNFTLPPRTYLFKETSFFGGMPLLPVRKFISLGKSTLRGGRGAFWALLNFEKKSCRLLCLF
jgi:hypothetical protein